MSLFNSAFMSSEKVFPNLTNRQAIESQYISKKSQGNLEVYGPGFGAAAALLLTGAATIHVNKNKDLYVRYTSMGKSQEIRTVHSLQTTIGRKWNAKGLDSSSAAPILAMGEALALGLYPDTLQSLRNLAKEVGYPATQADLQNFTADSNPHHIGLIHAVCNATYHEITQLHESSDIGLGRHTPKIDSGDEWTEVPSTFIAGALGLNINKKEQETRPLERLRRLMKRGGAALLIGPPGTFKTETIKRLALDTGASVVKMRGAPGVEDRDFIGAVLPLETGPQWVDGPLPTAFTLARHGKTILHIDEILRYHYIHLNILVGAMDELNAKDIHAVLEPPLRLSLAEQLQGEQLDEQITKRLQEETPNPNGRYYMLTLPSGEILTCPKENLLFAMTTNFGEDNLQTSQDIDSALLSRIHLVIDYKRPDVSVLLPIYEEVSGGNAALAQAAYNIESMTHEMMQDATSPLARALDPRKTIAMIEEARAEMEEGQSLSEALLSAAKVTALPHCISRDTHGNLESVAYEMLLKKIERSLSIVQTLSSV